MLSLTVDFVTHSLIHVYHLACIKNDKQTVIMPVWSQKISLSHGHLAFWLFSITIVIILLSACIRVNCLINMTNGGCNCWIFYYKKNTLAQHFSLENHIN